MEWTNFPNSRLTNFSRLLHCGLIGMILFAAPTTSHADQRSARLNAFMAMCESKGLRVIDGYHVENDVLFIDLDSDSWGSVNKDMQLRMCTTIANLGALEEMHLALGYLTLDNGATKVGSISHVAFGPGYEFTPNDDYWKYR